MPAFLDSLDIANRACQHLGVERIVDPTEDSRQNKELSAIYNPCLDSELKRNDWRFAMKRVALRPLTTTTLSVAPALYNAAQLYLPGSLVTDSNANIWVSVTPENLGNTPGTSSAWDQYFGPLTADVYQSGTSYFAGELVYKQVPQPNQTLPQPGGYVVFMSLQSGNSEDPGVADAWSSTTIYGQDAVVSYSGSQWRSLIDINQGITPADAPLAYQPATTYSTNQTVVASDGFIYSSLGNSNLGNDPVTDGGIHWGLSGTAAWTRSPAIYPGSSLWTPLFASLNTIFMIYPLGAGPQEQNATRNLFRLPANYLKTAPQTPKAGATNYLGAPHAAAYDDWEYTDSYIISSYSGVMVFRFVARIANVQVMDPMFCEGLACRMALEACQVLTQSEGKFQQVGSAYKLAITEARTANGIEQGPTEPPEDDWIMARL